MWSQLPDTSMNTPTKIVVVTVGLAIVLALLLILSIPPTA